MNIEQLNKSDNNTICFKVNNYLDFSFGDENNENKNDDIDMDMIDYKENKIKNQENQVFCINNSKIDKNEINNFTKYDFIFEKNENTNELSKNTKFLISKKRKRLNEFNNIKQLQKNNIKSNKSQMNIAYKEGIYHGCKFNDQENMEIKEDSTEFDYEIDDNKKMVNDNFDINVAFVINKFKKFNINKDLGFK